MPDHGRLVYRLVQLKLFPFLVGGFACVSNRVLPTLTVAANDKGPTVRPESQSRLTVVMAAKVAVTRPTTMSRSVTKSSSESILFSRLL